MAKEAVMFFPIPEQSTRNGHVYNQEALKKAIGEIVDVTIIDYPVTKVDDVVIGTGEIVSTQNNNLAVKLTVTDPKVLEHFSNHVLHVTPKMYGDKVVSFGVSMLPF